MDRAEFLDVLRNQLSGQMQEGRAAAHVRYYEDYIQSQVRGGRNEAEVLAELGDPRLIAKTLLDTDTGAASDSGQEMNQDGQGYQDYQGYQGYSGTGTDSAKDRPINKRSYKLDLSTWYGKAIVIVIAAVLMIALVTLIGAVLPFFLILGVILFVFSRLRKK